MVRVFRLAIVEGICLGCSALSKLNDDCNKLRADRPYWLGGMHKVNVGTQRRTRAIFSILEILHRQSSVFPLTLLHQVLQHNLSKVLSRADLSKVTWTSLGTSARRDRRSDALSAEITQ